MYNCALSLMCNEIVPTLHLFVINVCISVDFIKFERNVFYVILWVSVYGFELQNKTDSI